MRISSLELRRVGKVGLQRHAGRSSPSPACTRLRPRRARGGRAPPHARPRPRPRRSRAAGRSRRQRVERRADVLLEVNSCGCSGARLRTRKTVSIPNATRRCARRRPRRRPAAGAGTEPAIPQLERDPDAEEEDGRDLAEEEDEHEEDQRQHLRARQEQEVRAEHAGDRSATRRRSGCSPRAVREVRASRTSGARSLRARRADTRRGSARGRTRPRRCCRRSRGRACCRRGA